MNVNRVNDQTGLNSVYRPRFLGPEDPLLGTDVFQDSASVESLPVAPEIDIREAETESGSQQYITDVMTSIMPNRENAKASAPKRRATHKAMPTSKPPPPCVNNPVPKPKPKPKASPTPEERRAWETVRRITTSNPRNQWENAFGREIENFSGHGRDYFEQAMEIAQRETSEVYPNAFVHRANRDPDHDSEGAGLGMSQPSSRVVVQGLVQDPDLPQNVVRGQPAQISPMTSMTTVDWESLSMDDPWTQEPREIHEF